MYMRKAAIYVHIKIGIAANKNNTAVTYRIGYCDPIHLSTVTGTGKMPDAKHNLTVTELTPTWFLTHKGGRKGTHEDKFGV